MVFARTDANNVDVKVNMGKVPNFQAQQIRADTGLKTNGAVKLITTGGIKHVIKRHANDKNNQLGVTDQDFEEVPGILTNPDRVVKGMQNSRGNEALKFVKQIGNKEYHVVMALTRKNELILNTMYIKAK